MDADGFPLATISERSIIDETNRTRTPTRRTPLRPADSNGGMENGEVSKANTQLSQRIENMSSLSEHNYNGLDTRTSAETSEYDNTMYTSYTTGSVGENDIVEIHQFSLADIDAYLDIYFETLDYRLRRYIGNGEQIQQFRLETKNRITNNANAREFQNVLLGKMSSEVVAAVTMSFPDETPTIPYTFNTPDRSSLSCLKSLHHWMAKKSNYIPTNVDECYIEMIGVKKSYRNHGIGAAMLECVEQFARQAGAKSLTIHTPNQQLQTYFERFGFNTDNSDNTAFWKWIFERQSNTKLSKALLSDDENHDFTSSGYVNETLEE